jgi:TRAP-type uncharacterized transport system fused permease subunit
MVEPAQIGAVTDLPPPPRHAQFLTGAAHLLFYVTGVAFLAYLSRYYLTGIGGPSLLAVIAVPLTLCLVVLNDLRHGMLYPRLGAVVPFLIALLYCAVALYAAWYLTREFDEIRIYRLGLWNLHDLAVGGAVAALVLEYTRRRYFALFVLNVALILYAVYGYLVPGMFHHPGMDWTRIVSAVSVEMSTGVFERPAATRADADRLVHPGACRAARLRLHRLDPRRFRARRPALAAHAAAGRGDRILRGGCRVGLWAANAATTGSATIPVLIKAGFPRVTAAAVETASSLGGQLMPPLMGIAAFLMADYMGKSYFDVVARGFAPAIIYFLGVAFAVWLLAARHHRHSVAPDVGPMRFMDWTNILSYLIAVGGLIYLMGIERKPAMTSAQTVFVYLFLFLTAIFVIRTFLARAWSLRELTRPFLRLIESFSTITAELTILLATLGILTAMFTITGVPTKVGVLLMEGAAINTILMVLVAFAFGYLIGMGLPVAPTYIVTAIVVAPFMIRAGLDPWVVHFFIFLVAVFGELSPPTSVTAAVTSRIADAPFVRTMFAAVVLCMPLLVMMGAVFTRPDLVVEPGWTQLPAFTLVLIGGRWH